MKRIASIFRGRRAIVTLVVAVLMSVSAVAYAGHLFNDVPEDHTFHNDIAWGFENGLTFGCNPASGGDLFCPEDPVTRGQMMAFFHRYDEKLDDGGANIDEIINEVINEITLEGTNICEVFGFNSPCADELEDFLTGPQGPQGIQGPPGDSVQGPPGDPAVPNVTLDEVDGAPVPIQNMGGSIDTNQEPLGILVTLPAGTYQFYVDGAFAVLGATDWGGVEVWPQLSLYIEDNGVGGFQCDWDGAACAGDIGSISPNTVMPTYTGSLDRHASVSGTVVLTLSEETEVGVVAHGYASDESSTGSDDVFVVDARLIAHPVITTP